MEPMLALYQMTPSVCPALMDRHSLIAKKLFMSKEKLRACFLLKLLRHAGEKTLVTEITESKCREKEFSSILMAMVFCPAFPIRERLEPVRQSYD